MNLKRALAALTVLLVGGVALVNTRRADDAAPRATGLAPSSSAASDPPVAAPSGTCAIRGPGVTREADLPFVAPGHPNLWVIASRCPEVGGRRAPSVVRVIDLDDDRRIVATLIRAEQGLHVSSVDVSGSAIAVTAAVAAPEGPDDHRVADRGSVFTWRFDTSDGIAYRAAVPQRVALRCGPADLTLTAALIPGPPRQPAGAAAVRLRNRSSRPCAVEGYPEVTGRLPGGEEVVGDAAIGASDLEGVSAGVFDSYAPPVIVLAPGHLASSRLESARPVPAAGYPSCRTLDSVDVALPDGVLLGRVELRMRACGLHVQSLVAGNAGAAG